MKDLFSMVGITKQALWKYHRRLESKADLIDCTLRIIRKIRRRHKRMSCRAIYYVPQVNAPVGRDAFEAIGFEHGFRLKRRRNKKRTTWSQNVEVFPNRIEGKTLTNINQVWQSDIFYYEEKGITFYGITIIDVYSRRLLSLHLSQSLQATENVQALKKAIKCRSNQNLVGCVFHSDRGSQYISDVHKNLLAHHGMEKSMCKLPQENAYAERVQDTIKNYYLCDAQLVGKDLNRVAAQIMRKYNYERPHSEIGMIPPIAYEKLVEKQGRREKPKMLIFKWDHELSTKNELLTKRKR
jgi:transposase InsO family protein